MPRRRRATAPPRQLRGDALSITPATRAYLPGVDGLRALAVIAVLVYHARPGWLPGGFLGVEVFFSISGFLITRSLLQEWQSTGRVSLRAFWLRRARRLLPALCLLLLVVMTYAVLLEPEVVAGLRADVVAALTYVTNWHLVLQGQSYFDAFEKPSLLRHLWSLAVEEQFYLLWPVLLAGGLSFLRPGLTFAVVLAGAAASAAFMAALHEPATDASRLYFGTDTRASGLLLGAALAFILSRDDSEARQDAFLTMGGVLALAGLGFVVVTLHGDSSMLYRGGFLVAGLLTCAALLGLVTESPLSRIVGCAPLRWLGERSYGVYLWHWPVFLLTWPEQPGLGVMLLQFAAVVAIAALSYRLVEQPVRAGALGRALAEIRNWQDLGRQHRGMLFAGGGGAAALTIVLAFFAATASAPERPAYFGLESVRIRQDATSPASIVPRATFASRIRTSFAELTSLPLPCPRGAAPACDGTPSLLVSVNLSPGAALLGDAALAEIPALEEPGPEVEDQRAQAVPATPLRMPEARLAPEGMPLVTAIGDSVMLGAAARLAGAIPNLDLDSQVGRQAWNAIALLRERQAAGQLGEIVLVHIGNNGTLTRRDFEEIMSVLGHDRQVIFLNTQVPRSWQEANNAVLAEGVRSHPNVTLIDWQSVTAGHPELFASDQVHLSGLGAELYTRLVLEAMLG